jgi:hypothetical protein
MEGRFLSPGFWLKAAVLLAVSVATAGTVAYFVRLPARPEAAEEAPDSRGRFFMDQESFRKALNPKQLYGEAMGDFAPPEKTAPPPDPFTTPAVEGN